MIPMINLPCNAASMSQVTPCQNVPVQTSQYNFPTCQQRQTNTQQMQTTACGPCSGTSQGPCTRICQPDTYIVTHQCAPDAPQLITNPCHPVFQSPCNPPRIYPSCSQLPQNILEQIRACVSNTAPIFILPSNCQQSPPQQQQQPLPAPTLQQTMTSSPPTATTYPPNVLTYPAAYYPPPPPPFYPYPIPMPFGDPFIRGRETAQNCGCYRKRDADPTDIRSIARAGCRYDIEPDEHYCTPTTDDTICSRRNCPSSLHLQALASQFLSMQGVIPCAATRLVLRKVPGSNVTTTMEDTMTRAQKAISVLTKDQLLSESRNAQQVNALINLHMTANPPPNIIPILTLVQLKMNLLKAQVEGLVNQKLMEMQGVGVEVDIELIDPTVLALKSDAELRDFLSVLRQKECDERVNVNFAPYRSQRAVAETRLSNVQNKIRQVEAEFDRRRCAMLPAPTLSSRIVQQFTRPCYSARFEDPRKLYSTLPPDSFRSPDPFTCVKPRSPKRLLLKPHASKPEATTQAGAVPQTRPNPASNPPKTTDDGGADRAKQNPVTPDQQCSTENCTCDRTTSEESVGEAKKKLRARIIEIDATSNVEDLTREASSLMKISNVCVRIGTEKHGANERKCGERDKTQNRETPCDAKCWMAKAYINVVDDVSVKTLTESESDTITLCEKIDAQDVCKSRGVIEIQSLDQIMNRREFGSSANLRQFEKQTDVEIAISRKDEAIKEYDIESKSLQASATSKAEQEEMKATTVAEVADDDPISSAQETERKSPDGKYISSLEITLKPEKERRKEEQKDKNGEISPLSTDKTREQSADEVPISKSKKKIRFHIVSMMRNIVYDENPEYQRKQKIDKIIATSGTEINPTTNPDIEKSDKYSSIENILRSAITHDNTGKDHSENMFPKRMDLLKLDRQCQTLFEAIKEDKQASAALLRANIFPPLKNLRKYVRNNERNGDNVGIYPSPIRKAGITSAKRLSHCNNVTENTLGTAYNSNAPYHSNLEDEESFISEIFSLISSRVVSFVQKIIMLNKRLLYPNSSTILRGSLNIDAFRKPAPIRDHSGLNSKDYDPSANILHYSPNQGTSRSSKHNFRDTSSLRVSKGEGYTRIHKIRHSIIEDGENGTKYLLINTSNHNRDSILTRNLGRPYEIQKSLLIRSRLKSSSNSQDHPYPFSLLKRTAERNAHESHRVKDDENTKIIAERKIYELKSNKKFWTLTTVTKTSENNGKEVSKTGKCSDEFKERISHEYYDDITHNNVSSVQKNTVTRNTATASNELVINVHDYLGLQTEIKCARKP